VGARRKKGRLFRRKIKAAPRGILQKHTDSPTGEKKPGDGEVSTSGIGMGGEARTNDHGNDKGRK